MRRTQSVGTMKGATRAHDNINNKCLDTCVPPPVSRLDQNRKALRRLWHRLPLCTHLKAGTLVDAWGGHVEHAPVSVYLNVRACVVARHNIRTGDGDTIYARVDEVGNSVEVAVAQQDVVTAGCAT
jgi:hypothetical protein